MLGGKREMLEVTVTQHLGNAVGCKLPRVVALMSRVWFFWGHFPYHFWISKWLNRRTVPQGSLNKCSAGVHGVTRSRTRLSDWTGLKYDSAVLDLFCVVDPESGTQSRFLEWYQIGPLATMICVTLNHGGIRDFFSVWKLALIEINPFPSLLQCQWPLFICVFITFFFSNVLRLWYFEIIEVGEKNNNFNKLCWNFL